MRKCDMCGDRLRGGEAPACVQACPHEAIRITVVDLAEVRELPARASSCRRRLTHPIPCRRRFTDRFRRPSFDRPTKQGLTLEHAHPSLVLMLVLTQLSVGGFLVELALWLAGFGGGQESRLLLSICLGLGYAGLLASLFHLGRPHLAYRAVLGWRHSWLSREVLAFGAFISLATVFVLAQLFAPGWVTSHPRSQLALLIAVVVLGVCGVCSSVMVYHVVRRPFWRASASGVKFAGTTVLLGLSTALASLGISVSGMLGRREHSAEFLLPLVAGLLSLVSTAKFLYEAADRRERHDSGSDPLRLTSRLLRGAPEGAGARSGWSLDSRAACCFPCSRSWVRALATLESRRWARFSPCRCRSVASRSSAPCSFARSRGPKMPGGLPS